MTKFVYLSDTHTEHMHDWKNDLASFKNKLTKDDILIIAGDFLTLPSQQARHKLLEYISEIPRYTIYVAGNHEYYNTSIERANMYFEHYEELNPKFKFLNNSSFCVDGITIHGGTMWSNVGDSYVSKKVEDGISDFSVIRDFTTKKMNSLHDEFIEFITSVNVDENSIIVTHFLPDRELVQDMYKDDLYNAYFCADVFMKLDVKPKYWVYGHNHDKFNSVNLNGTTFVTNQFGYYSNNNFGDVEYKSFEMEKL